MALCFYVFYITWALESLVHELILDPCAWPRGDSTFDDDSDTNTNTETDSAGSYVVSRLLTANCAAFPAIMDHFLSPSQSTGPSTHRPKDRAASSSPLSSSLSADRNYNTRLASPPPVGRTYTQAPQPAFEEPLGYPPGINSHSLEGGVNLMTQRSSRPRDELHDLTEQEKLRVEWDMLMRKKDKYKTWKKRTKDDWRELEDAKVLMEANRQRLREDETMMGSEKRMIQGEREKLEDEMRVFRAVQKDVERQKMELEEQRMRLVDDREVLVEDMEKFHLEKEEYEEERGRHAEETVVLRQQWEEIKGKYDAELKRMEDARQAFHDDLARYEKERRIYEAIRHVLEQHTPQSPTQHI